MEGALRRRKIITIFFSRIFLFPRSSYYYTIVWGYHFVEDCTRQNRKLLFWKTRIHDRRVVGWRAEREREKNIAVFHRVVRSPRERVVVKISRNARKSPGRWLNGALSIQSGDTWSPYLGFVGWIDKSRPTTLLGREWRGERVGGDGGGRWMDDGDARKRGVENGSR